jgi:uncharacterized protein YqcC (DUF446 family)
MKSIQASLKRNSKQEKEKTKWLLGMVSSGMLRRVALVRTTQPQPHGVTSQKTPFFIVTAVKTSNFTKWLLVRKRTIPTKIPPWPENFVLDFVSRVPTAINLGFLDRNH